MKRAGRSIARHKNFLILLKIVSHSILNSQQTISKETTRMSSLGLVLNPTFQSDLMNQIGIAVFPSTYPSFGRTGFFQIPMRFSKIFSLHAHASAHTWTTILQAKSTTNGRLSNFVIVCKTRPSSSHWRTTLWHGGKLVFRPALRVSQLRICSMPSLDRLWWRFL